MLLVLASKLNMDGGKVRKEVPVTCKFKSRNIRDVKAKFVYKVVSECTVVKDDLQSVASRPRLRAYENFTQVRRASEQTICTAYTPNKYPYLGNRLKYISLFSSFV